MVRGRAVGQIHAQLVPERRLRTRPVHPERRTALDDQAVGHQARENVSPEVAVVGLADGGERVVDREDLPVDPSRAELRRRQVVLEQEAGDQSRHTTILNRGCMHPVS